MHNFLERNSHINIVTNAVFVSHATALQYNGGELTVTRSWQEPAHSPALTPAPGRLCSCCSSGEGWGAANPKGRGFFSLHSLTQSVICI